MTLTRSAVSPFICLVVLSVPAFGQFDVDKFDVPEPAPARTTPVPEKPPTEAPRDAARPSDPEPQPGRRDVDPEVVRLNLTDGSIVSGKFTISHITVETEFGPLDVPITRIRRVVPGLESHASLYGRIRELIEDLASDDYKQRETAEQELFKMGPPVRAELELYRDDSSAERARRVKAILARLDELSEDDFGESEAETWIREDTIETVEFTIVGKVSPETFTVNNRFGTLTIDLDYITSIERGEESEDIRKSLTLPGTYLVQRDFKNTGILVEKGDRISVRADGRIVRSGSSSYFSTPSGNSRLQTYTSNPTIYGGTLVARLGKNGKIVKVGTSTSFTADKSGMLYLAIAMSANYARYAFVGSYNVKLKVDRGEDASRSAAPEPKEDPTPPKPPVDAPADTVPAAPPM